MRTNATGSGGYIAGYLKRISYLIFALLMLWAPIAAAATFHDVLKQHAKNSNVAPTFRIQYSEKTPTDTGVETISLALDGRGAAQRAGSRGRKTYRIHPNDILALIRLVQLEWRWLERQRSRANRLAGDSRITLSIFFGPATWTLSCNVSLNRKPVGGVALIARRLKVLLPAKAPAAR